MKTYHLKFDSEEQASVVLYDNDMPVYPNTDVIGEIDGADGWHVNVYSDEEHTELDQHAVYPATPVRVLA